MRLRSNKIKKIIQQKIEVENRIKRSPVIQPKKKIQPNCVVKIEQVKKKYQEKIVFEKRITRSQVVKPNCVEKIKQIKTVEPRKSEKQIQPIDALFVKKGAFKKNDIVLAKQRNSVPWPAQILTIEKRVRVFFFGDGREGVVNSGEIYDFVASSSAISVYLKRKNARIDYKKGIKEVERLLSIPSDLSLIQGELLTE